MGSDYPSEGIRNSASQPHNPYIPDVTGPQSNPSQTTTANMSGKTNEPISNYYYNYSGSRKKY